MIPVNQSIIHDPKNGKNGDCWRAAIASVLELSINEVPHFGDMEYIEGIKAELRFLMKYGFSLYRIYMPAGEYPKLTEDECPYYFIVGASPRDKNITHQVVGYKGKIIHDPHPDKTGLTSINHFEILFKL